MTSRPSTMTTAAVGNACPSCGVVSRGRFCHQCGIDITTTCPDCSYPGAPGSQFCGRCGIPLSATAQADRAPRRSWLPWLIGSSLVVVLVALMLREGSLAASPGGPATPAVKPQGLAAPPDLSAMSPRERFDRLYQRVITAAQQGDQATVTQFTPMAVAAYQQLDSITVDARYHLAMLQLHVGNLTGAQAQADTIRTTRPEHLFGYVIGAAVARWTKQDATRDQLHREFAARYDREIATRKTEYLEHQAMLAEVQKAVTVSR